MSPDSAVGKQTPRSAFFYVLRCKDDSLYTGYTMDLTRRLRAHAEGKGARYTRGRAPLELLAFVEIDDAGVARSLEGRFKRLTREAKLAMLQAADAFGVALVLPPFIADVQGDRMSHQPPQPEELDALLERARTSKVRIGTTKGDLVFTFYPDEAPMHSAAFLKLVDAKFYDGLTFHRVEPGFVIQGGEPSGNGTGGPGYRLKAEFSDKPHVRGAVAMARSSDPNSAGSQFYVCLDDARFLDKQYTVFGQLCDGYEALDAIRVGDAMTEITVEPK